MSDLLAKVLPKINTLQRIVDKGIVAVVRAESSEQGEKIAKACLEGGIDTVEITFTVPGAHKVIEGLRNAFTEKELVIGAGTVLDAETARVAILAGAQYIVSPGLDLEAVKLCNRYQIPSMAGCMTPTEIIKALEAGTDVIKIFPGEALGPSYVKAIKGPLPQAPLMPTGGVSLENVAEWIKNGCIAVGVGGQLTAGAKTGDYKKIADAAREFVKRIREARGA